MPRIIAAPRDFHTLSKLVAAMHNDVGGSAVTFDGRNVFQLTDGTPLRLVPIVGVPTMDLPKKEITRKDVGAYLFKHRKARGTLRAHAVVWTVYDNEVTTIGIGAVVPEIVADRYMVKGAVHAS
jgi:hypothetical protein